MASDSRTPELDEIIVQGLSDGIPLRQLARLHGFGKSSFYDWCASDPFLAGRVARAREDGFDAIADEALAIADDGTRDTVTDGEGHRRPDAEWISRSKLRVETRLKLLACWSPARYGPKVDVAHSGAIKADIAVRFVGKSG